MNNFVLTDTDYRILKFISDNPASSYDFIKSGLPDILTLKFRLDCLSNVNRQYLGSFHIPIDDKPYIINNNNCYTISVFGKHTLENYIQQQNKCRLEFILKNAVMPILVSLVVNLLFVFIKYCIQLEVILH